jgi:serine/threonine protein kinase
MSTERIIDDTFIVHKTLGQGFTSKVVLAEHRETGYKLALKIFKPIRQMKLLVENFRKEVDSMKNLKHDNLINIIAANENGIYVRPGKQKENIMYLGVELAENAELFDFIADPGYGFSEQMARCLFKQLISGLNAMHEMKVAHRDLKTENLFLDKNFHLKIGDFGFAKFMDPHVNDGKLKTQLGTSGYQCPELIEGQGYSGESNDIFACGVILFILVNAYPPFREARKTDNWYRHIYYEKIENFWMLHSKKVNISKELKELISGMLRCKNRYTMKDLVNSEWLKGELPSEKAYLEDMLVRKAKVDERRERDRQETLKGGEEEVDMNGQYRGENEQILIDSLFDQIKDDVDSFPVKKLSSTLPKHFFRFKGTDVVKTYYYFIGLLVEEKGEIDLLNKDNFSLLANIPYSSIEMTDESSTGLVSFYAELSVDENTQTTVVSFIKNSSTEYHEFTSFMNSLSKKIKDN